MKPWRKMTAMEIYQIKKTKCQFCRYAAGTTENKNGFGGLTCNYILDEHQRRGVDPRECEYYKLPGDRKRRRNDEWNAPIS